jgi:TFIIF-interacting CTD phosphatase-like protein
MTRKRLKVILDLDQTLISAESTTKFDFAQNSEKASRFNFHDMNGYYIVFERPKLQSFLDYLFENFDVSVWTAASKDYALFIINKVILANPDRKLDWVFFSYHCGKSKKIKNTSKDLSMLWDVFKIPGYNIDNTVILDDNIEVYNAQPKNAILVPAFEFIRRRSHKDDFLKELTRVLELRAKV